MKQENLIYRIFDYTLHSSILLPELPLVQDTNTPEKNILSFNLKTTALSDKQSPEWFHHWYLYNGKVSLSCGRTPEFYYLRFPHLADFEISIADNTITCFPAIKVDTFAIRHLLLDQVIPRLLSHQGLLILHASAVTLDKDMMLFLGETGHGKSTLAMAFQQHDCQLITDDCISLNLTANQVTGIPNYIGARLWPDSLAALNQKHKHEKLGASEKSRIYFPIQQSNSYTPRPVKAIFFLDTLSQKNSSTCCSITPVIGSDKFIKMNKQCFPLDITDKESSCDRFQNMAKLGNIDSILFAKLSYKKEYKILPEICKTVLSTCADYSVANKRQIP